MKGWEIFASVIVVVGCGMKRGGGEAGGDTAECVTKHNMSSMSRIF